MRICFKYKWISGFGKWYNYAFKYTHMITKQAEQRLNILNFWHQYGLLATFDAFRVKRSTLYYWQKMYQSHDCKLESLNPKSQAPLHRRKRLINWRIIQKIRRLRLEVCPNMGKDKVKIFLDRFCRKNSLKPISASTIGRMIKDKKIYHNRQKVSHFGKIKVIQRKKKLRKPKGFEPQIPGDLIEIDTVVKFGWQMKRYIITAIDVKTRYSLASCLQRSKQPKYQGFFPKTRTSFSLSDQAHPN